MKMQKYHQYSLSFYQREKELSNVTNRVRLGFSHFNEKVLKAGTAQLFAKFNESGKATQRNLLQDDSQACLDMFFDLIKTLGSDRDLMEYVLATLDAIFTQERTCLREAIRAISQGKYSGITTQIRAFLVIENHSQITYLAAARVASILLGQLPKEQFGGEQRNFLLDLLQARRGQTKVKISEYGLVSCFVHLNKHVQLAQVFIQNGGTVLLLDCLSRTGNDIQLIYYSLLNVWMLSYLPAGIERFIGNPRVGIIKLICEVLQKVSREKITRIAFTIFKAIQHNNNCLQLMIDNKLIKIIDTILKGNIKDPELLEAIKEIGLTLETNMKVLSSFEKYIKELTSQYLEWNSVHTQRFWKENAVKCQADDYKVLKHLKILLMSKRPLNVAIACYDVGEFTRYYPRGKAVVQSLGLKDLIMERARFSEDKAVREQALLSLQKIMIQNWQAI